MKKMYLILPAIIFIVLGLFQNCGSLDGFDTEFSTYEDIHAGCPQGRMPNGDCIYLTPEVSTQQCSIENGVGLQVYIGDGQWGACAAQTCNEGYQKVGSNCEFIPVVRACTVLNGTGEEVNDGRGFGNCNLKSCSVGYHIANNACAFTPITESCVMTNGTGQRINMGAGFGPCSVLSCNAGYNIANNACVFAPITRNCTIANGTGTQTNSGAGFSACRVTSCNSGYAAMNNVCTFVRVSRACPILNGVGVQENTGSGFQACQVQSCSPGYRIQSNSCAFIPVTRACPISMGVGTQTNTGAGFGACLVQSCNAGYRIVNNTCSFIAVTRACPIPMGTGTQTNTGSGFGACQVSSCNATYRIEGNSCVSNRRTCTILNGSGTQNYNLTTRQWGICTIASCSAGYVANARVGFCVKASAPIAKVNIHVARNDNGTGNAIWTDSFINAVISKINFLLKGNIIFNLNQKTNINDSNLYSKLSQESFGNDLVHLRRFTQITAVVSNPATNDAAGQALNIRYNYEPFFAMRSRKNNGSDADALEVAQIFLHELGHNMGMAHDYGGPVHMDNRYIQEPEVYINYVNGMNACTDQFCQDRYAKYGSFSGGSDR